MTNRQLESRLKQIWQELMDLEMRRSIQELPQDQFIEMEIQLVRELGELQAEQEVRRFLRN